jgi:surfeit locus 1 family protein
VLRLEFGDYRLLASAGMTALALAGVLLFTGLGRWQWHRAEEKRELATAFAAGTAEFTGSLGARSTASLARYARVRARGRYDTARQFLLDNMSHDGRTGYEVLTPFRLDDGRLLLVNRGWVPLPGGRRDALPDIALPDAGQTDISGRLDRLPVTGLSAGRAPPSADARWPKRSSFPDDVQLGTALGEPIEAGQLLLAPGEPHGYLRDWRSASVGFGPERHVGYAVQWWGLAALIAFLYMYMNVERRAP